MSSPFVGRREISVAIGGGTPTERQFISRRVKTGKLVKLFSGIYTDEVDCDPRTIISEKVWEVAFQFNPA
jgi:hypothetical protein